VGNHLLAKFVGGFGLGFGVDNHCDVGEGCFQYIYSCENDSEPIYSCHAAALYQRIYEVAYQEGVYHSKQPDKNGYG